MPQICDPARKEAEILDSEEQWWSEGGGVRSLGEGSYGAMGQGLEPLWSSSSEDSAAGHLCFSSFDWNAYFPTHQDL